MADRRRILAVGSRHEGRWPVTIIDAVSGELLEIHPSIGSWDELRELRCDYDVLQIPPSVLRELVDADAGPSVLPEDGEQRVG